MKFVLEPDEFNTKTLIKYLNLYYGSKRNGLPFTTYSIEVYIRIGRLPKAYGGHRLTTQQHYLLNGVKILKVEGLKRVEVNKWMREYPEGIVGLEKIAQRKWRAARNKRNKDKRKEVLAQILEEKRAKREMKKMNIQPASNYHNYFKDEESTDTDN